MMDSYKQPSAMPTPKVVGATTGAAGIPGLALVLVWVGQQFGVEIPSDVAIWVAGVLGAIGGGWSVSERWQDR